MNYFCVATDNQNFGNFGGILNILAILE